jgi:hypothetical protein
MRDLSVVAAFGGLQISSWSERCRGAARRSGGCAQRSTRNGEPAFVEVASSLPRVCRFLEAHGGALRGHAGRAVETRSGPARRPNIGEHDFYPVVYSGPDEEHQGKGDPVRVRWRDRNLPVGQRTGGFTEIWDVMDKSNIEVLASFRVPGLVFSHNGWTTEEQDFLFIGDELDELVQAGWSATRRSPSPSPSRPTSRRPAPTSWTSGTSTTRSWSSGSRTRP